MKQSKWLAVLAMSFAAGAETMTNPENGEVWVLTDKGAYNAVNSELIKHQDKYYGSDGRIYLRQGDRLIQIGGPRTEQTEPPLKIQIQITAPQTAPVPLFVPLHPRLHPFRVRRSSSPKKH